MNLAFSFCVLVLHSRAQSGNLWLRTCVRVSVATEGNLNQLGFKFSALCGLLQPGSLSSLHTFHCRPACKALEHLVV